MEKEYLDIPVTIGQKEQSFNYKIVEDEASGQRFKIWSEGKELYMDEDLGYLKGDMPTEWTDQAVLKLQSILQAHQHPDGP
ncbi:hypothetical protein [Olivibacter sp. XZL3]|uniref:hypothetical protein n=1 Tax=Olivibacter sp. XZL3 TaxID=1735116 RepID=UPI001066DBAD|nr:hypothetical protein [Olivibacter sp. XZL3]